MLAKLGLMGTRASCPIAWCRMVALGALVLFAACDGDEARMDVHLEGLVTDSLGVPIPGATITIPSRGSKDKPLQATSDESGYFSTRFHGFGTFEVIVTAEGYARYVSAVSTSDMPDVAGGFLSNARLDPQLYPLTARLRGRLTQSQGNSAPLSGAGVQLRLGESTIKDPSITLKTTTNARGEYAFEGLPSGASVTVYVEAVDVDGDGQLDTAATSFNASLGYATTVTVDRQIGLFSGSATILWSNLAGNGLMPVDGKFELLFSMAIDTTPARVDVTLTRLGPFGSQPVAFTSVWSEGDTFLTVTPRAPLTAGEQYQLAVVGYTKLGALGISRTFPFTARSEGAPAEPKGLELDREAQPKVTSIAGSVSLIWDAVPEADQYAVYARETTGDVSDWVRLMQLNVSSLTTFHPRARTAVALNFEFRPNGFPFTDGEKLQLAVSALKAGEESGLSNVIEVGDEECPSALFLSFSPGGSWNNAASSEDLPVYVQLGLNEPVPLSSTLPLTFSSALTGSTFRAEWTSRTELRLIGEVPAGVNAAGLTATVNLSQLKDPSGNAVCTGKEAIAGVTPGS